MRQLRELRQLYDGREESINNNDWMDARAVQLLSRGDTIAQLKEEGTSCNLTLLCTTVATCMIKNKNKIN